MSGRTLIRKGKMKLNYKRTVLVGFAFFLICAVWQAYDSIVPMMLVNKFGLSQSLSGIIMSIDNVVAIFLLPLFGSLSDKTQSKFGRRTPYIVIGTVLAVVAFMGLTFTDNAQLAKISANDGASFYEQVFDGNYEIVNAEYNSFTNKGVPESFKVQDYASMVVKNKTWSELNDSEKDEVKSWYKSINAEYLEDHSKPETVYAYVDGVYKTVAWVVSVMLPPMAIFFPLFTLLEDFGYLPRIAFNLDRCFKRCNACGKQALTM